MSKPKFKTTSLAVWVGLAVAFLVMFVVGLYDLNWTAWLVDHRWETFADIMDRSIFEGESFGGGDPIIILLVFVLFAYIVAWLPGKSSRFHALRPQLGFILSSGLLCGVVMVQSLKNTIGRARPGRVLDGRMPFSDWFEMGPYLLLDGSFNGSFPSGHTAQAFIIMTLVYCLLAYPQRVNKLRITGYLFGGLALIYVFAMALSRTMHISHWLGDVCASIILSWICYHLFYFRLFKVPQQTAYWLENGTHLPLPTAWEMRLCGLILCVALGGMAFVIGLRAFVESRPLITWLLVPCGALWSVYFFRIAKRYHSRVTSVLAFSSKSD